MKTFRNRKANFPGWKMTVDQHNAYWRLLGQVCAAQNITNAADRESMRKLIHLRAFNGPKSAKDIDHLKDFDEFKKECLAWIKPDDLDAQKRMADMPLIRLRHRIRDLADEPYIAAMVRSPLFGKQALEDLTEPELERLRNTLCDRQAEQHKPETLARRRAARQPALASANPDWTVP